MKLLNELNVTDQKENLDILISDPLGVNALKVFISGTFTAPNETRLMLRVNNQATGYRSFLQQSCDSGNGEWDMTGFYFGRAAWVNQANLCLEYTISAEQLSQTLIGFGQSMFSYPGNGKIIGSICYGSLIYGQPVSPGSISLFTNGGLFTGTMKVYAM